ncbi:substrate-binding domain-containing protein [Sulfitobacter dubius]|uniref:Tungstate-binding protein TupA n=1 Tax=Sulfitobacter dubius TaxID=218673 RepID=A0ABY3ZRX9_9RHOB|nr:substrate-binding domain-containing protein [Sulfitobacter dubius]UOA16884.1 Tungstate-binding protein TupA [Sulfitobacter dubius]|tara:strand:- start:78 stop:890 length:813 start_codon:yes stop_codon:yes gene_type:complete
MKHWIMGAISALAIGSAAQAADVMKMAVTTSFNNSGLADVLLPEIAADLDLEVQLLVVGTGQALKLGEAGDVDAILVHSRKAEEAFVAGGFGSHRTEIMYNDFVFIGPKADPAAIAGSDAATAALAAIADAGSNFVSRGDDSGTHKKELSLWAEAGLDPVQFGDWYNAVGAGMGAALNTASGMPAYVMSDRASWLNFGNKGDLALLYAGDPVLFNQYAYLPVNPEMHAHVKNDLALKLEEWLISDRAKALINDYKINGGTLFVFNAKTAE